jgi:hypothetical protein
MLIRRVAYPHRGRVNLLRSTHVIYAKQVLTRLVSPGQGMANQLHEGDRVVSVQFTRGI